MKSKIKSILRHFGLFAVARKFYRSLSPSHIRERRFNQEFYSNIVNKNDLCFDIGANLGQTTEALVDLGVKVVAVEPNPHCLPVLNFHFKKNQNVTIITKAIASSRGFGDLHFTGTDSTASFREDWGFKADKKERIETVTLDDMITEYGLPTFLKVDVEGFELEVFKGLSKSIKNIYFEMHGHEINLVLQIFAKLHEIGEIVGVKVISGDNSTWLIDDWCPTEQFIEKLGTPLPRQANIIIRMK